MLNYLAIVFPFLAGVFFLIGFGIVKLINDKKRLSIFAVSMAFVVMIGIIFLDLLPEIMDISSSLLFEVNFKIFLMVGTILFGFFILKFFDLFIPSHHHSHHDNERNHLEHDRHLVHIGFITSFSLMLHNIIEGISIYILTLESFTGGFLLSIAVGLHNLPLGIEIASGLEHQKSSRLNMWLCILLSISSFIGVLFIVLFKVRINDIILLSLMCISLGMILYISLFELLKELYNYKNKKDTFYGLFCGIVILFVMQLFS